MRLPAVPGEFAHHEEADLPDVRDIDEHFAMLGPWRRRRRQGRHALSDDVPRHLSQYAVVGLAGNSPVACWTEVGLGIELPPK